MTAVSPIFDVMTVPPPEVSAEEAAAAALAHWGLAGRLRPLSGERDRNFRLTTADGDYVLKFANPAEPADFRAMQGAVLAHIAAADPLLRIPRTIPTRSGAGEALAAMHDGRTHPARLLTWIGGLPIGQSRRSAAQRSAYGGLAARLQRAMAGFAHPGAATPIIWDLQHAMHLREAAFAVPDATARAALEQDLAEFEVRVLPLMPTLRRQVLHDDLNRANVLVDPQDHNRIVGLIDFGDTTETALIFDLAIVCSSQQGEDMDLVSAVSHMLRAYAPLHPIPREEAALIPLLIRTRMMMSITLGCWHVHMQPGNTHHSHNAAHVARTLALRGQLLGEAPLAALMAASGQR